MLFIWILKFVVWTVQDEAWRDFRFSTEPKLINFVHDGALSMRSVHILVNHFCVRRELSVKILIISSDSSFKLRTNFQHFRSQLNVFTWASQLAVFTHNLFTVFLFCYLRRILVFESGLFNQLLGDSSFQPFDLEHVVVWAEFCISLVFRKAVFWVSIPFTQHRYALNSFSSPKVIYSDNDFMSVSTDESDLGRIFLIEKFFASEAFLFTGTEWVKFSHLAFSPCTCVGYFAYISRLENTRCMILIFLFGRPHNDMSLHSIYISSRKKVSISNFPDQIFQINIQILSSLPFQFFFLSEVSLIVFFRFFHIGSTEVSS